MQRLYSNYFASILMLFILSACVSVPSNLDTVNKNLAAAEISWKNTLLMVKRNTPRMNATMKTQVKHNLIQVNEALSSARLAVALTSGTIDISSDLAVVNSGLTVVRTLLEELEKQENAL